MTGNLPAWCLRMRPAALSLLLAAACIGTTSSARAQEPEQAQAEQAEPAQPGAIRSPVQTIIQRATGNRSGAAAQPEDREPQAAAENAEAETEDAPSGAESGNAPAEPPPDATGGGGNRANEGDQPPAAPEAAAIETAREIVEADDTMGERMLKSLSGMIVGMFEGIRSDIASAGRTIRSLSGLREIEIDELKRVLSGILVLIGTCAVWAITGRALIRPFLHRLGESARNYGPVRTLAVGIIGAALDLFVLLMAVPAAILVTNLAGIEIDADQDIQTAVLAAYMVSAWLIVVVRMFLSPASRYMRVFNITGASARSITRTLSAIILLITFGEVAVYRILLELTNVGAASAGATLINVAALTYFAIFFVANRKRIVDYYEARAAKDEDLLVNTISAAVAPYLHYVVLIYLAFVIHQTMTTGGAGLSVLIATAKLTADTAVASLIISALTSFEERGLKLPARLAAKFPLMEERINAFAPHFYKFLKVIVAFLWLGVALQIVGVAALWDWAESEYGINILQTITSFLFIVVSGFIVWLLITAWIDYRLSPRHGREPTPREQTLFALLRNASLVAILIIGLIYALAEIGVSVAPLLASAGVVGLAIGFGSQKLVQDIITGVFIQFENAINVGDVIEAGGKTGTVEKLTIRSVSLRDLQGVYHVIPFSSVDLVSNHMKGFSFHVADVRIAYREDIDAAKAVMLDAYEEMLEDPIWSTKLLGGIEWFGVETITELAVILRARLKTRPGEQWAVGRAYLELVKKRFDESGIEIPFQHRTIWFGTERDGEAPPARLEISRPGGRASRAPAASPPAETGPTRQTIAQNAPTDADEDI